MARKSEKSKAKAKSPDKSPRRVGRPSRRRKKSDSESSEEKKASEPAEVEQGESSESGRMRRSTRRQPEPSTSEPKPQANEWKEDESFWSKDKEEEDKNKTEAGQEDGGTVWKVQTSNGSGGEIQKLRICRQRPGGAGSDSAESSMSPAKDSSSPLHKKALKKESQKSPLVESSLAEIELPPTAGTSELQDASEISLPPNQASDDAVPETNSMPQKVVEYVYETQPSVALAEKNTSQVNESDPASVEAKGQALPSITEQTVEESKTVEESQIVKESPTVEESKTVEDPQTVGDSQTVKELQTVEESVTVVESQLGKETVEQPALDKKDQEHVKEMKVSLDAPAENQPGDSAAAEVKVPEPESAKEDKVEADTNKEEEQKPVESVEDIPPPVEPPPKAQPETVKTTDPDPDKEKEGDGEKNDDTEKETTKSTETSQPESSRSPTKDISSAIVEGRRKSDSSVKSGGSRRSSVSGPANSEYNEPLLEISVNKSPMQEGKEEGEIVDDEKTEVSDHKDKRRVVSIRTKSEEASPAKINTKRRSTAGESSTSNNASKTGSTPATPATTAKKHPLITGPEPDESPAVRRRKLTALATTRTITAGGTSRPVRSIPGEALKAVLLPDADKKDKEKRPKLIKVKDEKPESGGDEVPAHESKVNKVEDVREILKNNRANEKKAAAEKESKHSVKSPVRATFTSEPKASTRKVSISTASVNEEVKSSKPSRSKSPGDSKATPILFITNLVRPFTAGQLKELLARTGTIVRNGFFIDKIKSKCFVKYADVEMATETRHALNGVRWPVSNPKVLKVAYATDKELKVIQDSAEGEIVDDITSPRSSGSGWLSSEQAAVKDKEKRKAAGPSTREWDRGKTKTGSDGDVIFIDEYSKEEKLKNAAMLHDMERSERTREHLDKEKPFKEDQSRNHSDRDKDRDRERRKRHSSPVDIEISSPPPARKFKKKDYDAPAKLLDDLFRKTKTSPCLYWLPLSAEQIAVKEETRRKHMAEHERRMAELKKSTQPRRDKERDRDRRRK